MILTTKGLILKQQEYKERDAIITVLTDSMGIIRCFTRGTRNLNNANHAAVAPMSFSELTIFQGRNSYSLNEGLLIKGYYELYEDISLMSLAQYFCQLAECIVPEGIYSEEYLYLTLGALKALKQKRMPPQLVKAAYEIRMWGLSGLMPDILACRSCGCYEPEHTMYFLVNSGSLLCENCIGTPTGDAYPLTRTALHALRHCILAEQKKLFAFTVSEPSGSQLSACAEAYCLHNAGQSFSCLDYYKQIADFEKNLFENKTASPT